MHGDQRQEARVVEAAITYLCPGSRVNRRFVAPGVECNTGRYEAHRVPVRDGRGREDSFSLDVHGFVLTRHRSAVKDFFDNAEVDRVYPAEAADLVQALTGADRVVCRGWMVRTSGDLSRHVRQVTGYTHQGGVQPPAAEAHVDFTPECAERLARDVYRQAFPDGPGFSRFIASSLWRCFSDPPQDTPLALCDARSVGRGEGVPNTLHIVDRLPDEETMFGEDPGGETAIAASVFHYSPAHQWWYFPDMARDEVVLFKFHDSDPERALRVPHTAFRDPGVPDAGPRSSIEVRTFAFFESQAGC